MILCFVSKYFNLTEFDEQLWSSIVDFVTVGRGKEITITFRDGTEMKA